MLNSPNLRDTDSYKVEGVQYETDAIALNLSDDDVNRAIGNRVEFSKSWWNREMNLDTIHKNVENIWLNLGSDDIDLYDYQEPYKENRIFVDVETLVARAVGQPPQPIVNPAFDTDASRDLAHSVEKVLLANYRNRHMHSKAQMIARHLLTGFRYAVLKYRWDNSIGRLKEDGTRTGGTVFEVVRPDKIVFDSAAVDKANIPMIAEYRQDSYEDLIWQFPDKKDEIMQVCGKSYGTSVQLTELTTNLEVHFTGHKPDTGEEYEGVARKLQWVVLDKMKNPNWNYDEMGKDSEGKTIYNNFFDKPRKPYIVFNYLNQGKYIVDSTSLVEQAKQLQRQLEKRGRQIDQNADSANAGMVLNSLMVTEENASKLIGDPEEKLMAKGNVNEAAARLPQNDLPSFVLEDKTDIRGAIDTIMGANAPIQGQQSGSPTLGQDELSIQRNSDRLGTLVTALEDGFDEAYKADVQMMKVFFTEDDFVKYAGPDGHAEFIEFSNQKIESGIEISVRAGTIMPDNPATEAQEAQEFAQVFDFLTFAEHLNVENPKEIASRMFILKTDPGEYGEKYLGIKQQAQHNPQAVQAIQQISQGQQPQIPENPTQDYVDQLKTHITSPAFKAMSPIARAQLLDHSRQVVSKLRGKLGSKPKQPNMLQRVGQGIKKTLFH